jgi:hypothetical protein
MRSPSEIMLSIWGFCSPNFREVFPSGGNHLSAASPRSVQRAKSTNVQFHVFGDPLAESLEVSLDDGIEGSMKNGQPGYLWYRGAARGPQGIDLNIRGPWARRNIFYQRSAALYQIQQLLLRDYFDA